MTVVGVLGLTRKAFSERMEALGVRAGRARELYRRAFREGAEAEGRVRLLRLPIVRRAEEGGTVKLVCRLEDGAAVETVVIPGTGSSGVRRDTLCVSSQVGCGRGCVFCQTAQMGLVRNLSAEEIVAQWFAARFGLDRPIRNVVFMGMGEPLDNLQAVIGALRVLADHDGPAIAASRLSVSTVGRDRGILELAALARTSGFRRLRLAVSINAPDDELRSRLMPINRSVPMARLMEAMLQWPVRDGSRILIEYVLIPGVNDADDHARKLCAYLRPLPCMVNVIPYNPRPNSPWPAPEPAAVERFIECIASEGQPVRRRQTAGRSVMAACGQLGQPLH